MRHHSLATLAAAALVFAACDSVDPVTPDPDFARGGVKGSGPGFRTSMPAQAQILVGGEMIPIATAGDYMPGSGERLDGIPDGIGALEGGRYPQAMMNHEIGGGSKVSYFTFDARTATVINHSYPIDGSEGYNRLCSASWNGAADGFPGGYFFTGEEAKDGIQLAIDRQGRVTELPHIGYYAHEQQVAVPGFRGYTVVVNFDDDGTSGSELTNEDAHSELYMYVARNANGVLRGNGTLYVFKSDQEANVGALTVGQTISGYWVAVPEAVALDRSLQPAGSDGNSRPYLDEWVDNAGAFEFTRLEDGFHDKARGNGNPAMYFFDTGDATLGSGSHWDKWGSIYRMEWDDPSDPTGAAHLSLLARSSGPGSGWASPDNGDMNAAGVIMLQEDPAAGPWTRDETQIWAFQRAGDGTLMDPAGTLIAETVGSDCLGDSGGRCWETSGIVDVSHWWGDNAWMLDVQSKSPRADCPECASDGQLLIMKVGGSFGFPN